MTGIQQQHRVDLPAGSFMYLRDAQEVDLFNEWSARLIGEYQFVKLNDLAQLGALLTQMVMLFRAQQTISGYRPKLDNSGVPTGDMEKVDDEEVAAANALLQKASDQIRTLEKALGIDKSTRESSGAYTLEDYLKTAKRAAHTYGIHINKRFIEHESFANDLRWRLRALFTWDAEDRAIHDITPDKILEWANVRLQEIEQTDKDYAHTKGKMFIGKL